MLVSTCKICKATKPISYFHTSQHNRNKIVVTCKACVYERQKIFRKTKEGKESLYAAQIKYRRKNKSRVKQWFKTAANTPNSRYKTYRLGARNRNIDFKLTFDQFMKFWNKPCHYCGDKIKTVGIDRVNNSIGYTEGNSIACCFNCNSAKRGQNAAEFIIRCHTIGKKFIGDK
mgnify:CR=1 FL=1